MNLQMAFWLLQTPLVLMPVILVPTILDIGAIVDDYDCCMMLLVRAVVKCAVVCWVFLVYVQLYPIQDGIHGEFSRAADHLQLSVTII